MADRVKAFMEAWTAKNLAFAGDPRDETANPEAEMLAESCAIEAEAAGITREQLEAVYCDLVAFMQGRLDAEVPA